MIFDVAYNNGAPISGTTQVNDIAIGTDNPDYTNGNWAGGVDDSDGYVIVSDTTTAGLIGRSTGGGTGTAGTGTGGGGTGTPKTPGTPGSNYTATPGYTTGSALNPGNMFANLTPQVTPATNTPISLVEPAFKPALFADGGAAKWPDRYAALAPVEAQAAACPTFYPIWTR